MPKYLRVLIGPTESHYWQSLPMDLLEYRIGGWDYRQAKAVCRWI